MSHNQNPEQLARDRIDLLLSQSGWVVQSVKNINLNVATGVAVREFPTETGPADYVLFVNGKACGLIEAKKADEGYRMTVHEAQSQEYARAKLRHLKHDPLRFVYESTGELTRFTDNNDPRPRSREVFSFHRPETFIWWLRQPFTLRAGMQKFPELVTKGLRDCQIDAVNKLEKSFAVNRPKALIRMATGSGKTFTAISFIYRLLKYAGARRILFLVDTRNLGEQAEQEFQAYFTNDDHRKFTELYNVQLLRSDYVAPDSQVCISTIQRMYAILRGEPLDDAAETVNPAEYHLPKHESLPVVYNERIPPEQFDMIVIDECHRSIYNTWKQVLDYFDAFQVGLTATPDNRTFAYFNQNVVSEYTYDNAVADNVLVPFNIYQIDTDITRNGAVIWKGEQVDFREKLTRRTRWAQTDEDVNYTPQRLDDTVVNPSQIRTIIRTFKERLPELFPGRTEVPKTLVFAKSDSHADDIIKMIREEFDEENNFCRKITYNTDNPKTELQNFRNEYHPRIAVTVDMIATGTDVKPLECLLFMRDVRSRTYFDQMKGRGTRTISLIDLQRVTPSATYTKDHFVLVDAVGVTRSLKSEMCPLERKPSESVANLLQALAVGSRDEEVMLSAANRLLRLEKRFTEKEKQKFAELAEGRSMNEVARSLINAWDPDVLDELRETVNRDLAGESPAAKEKEIQLRHDALLNNAARIFTGELIAFTLEAKKTHEQIIDVVNLDAVNFAGWDKNAKEISAAVAGEFEAWVTQNRDELIALQLFYAQPYRRRELTYKMVSDLLDTLKLQKPALAPLRVWQAYEAIDNVTATPRSELMALVALVRRVCGLDSTLTPCDKTVDRNFRDWILRKNAGQHNRFTEEQMNWLRMMKEHIAASFHLDAEDLDYTPFDAQGGRGKMWQLFGEEMDALMGEMNEVLMA